MALFTIQTDQLPVITVSRKYVLVTRTLTVTPLNLVPCMVPPLASTKKLIMKSALAGAFRSPLLRLPLAYVASLLPPRPFAPA